MKLIAFFSLSLLTYSGLSIFSGKQKIELKIGDKAPSFNLKDQNKTVHRLSDYLGKSCIVLFPKSRYTRMNDSGLRVPR